MFVCRDCSAPFHLAPYRGKPPAPVEAPDALEIQKLLAGMADRARTWQWWSARARAWMRAGALPAAAVLQLAAHASWQAPLGALVREEGLFSAHQAEGVHVSLTSRATLCINAQLRVFLHMRLAFGIISNWI